LAKIGSLTADLKLESAAFIRDLKKAADATARNTSAMQRQVAGLQKSFASASNSFKGFVAGFVSLAAVRSLVNLGNQAIKTADDIGAAATAIGISGESLQRFRFAAQQTDVSVEALDGALKIFQKNIATGKLKSQSFDEFIESIRQAPTQIEKVRVAQEGLGKQFQTGLLLAAQSGAEFKRQYDSAFVISDKALKIASDLDNQFRALSDAVAAGFATGFIESFAGSLGSTQDQLKEINRLATEIGATVGAAFKFIADSATSVAGAIRTINEQLQPIADFLNFAAGVSPIGASGTTGATSGFSAAAVGAVNLGDAAKAAVPSVLALNDAVKASAAAAADLQMKTAQSFGDVTKTYIDGVGQITSTLAGAFQEQKGFAIANAVVNVAEGITRALTLPFPLNWAQVGAVTAAGAAQIAAISSARPGSSRRPSVGGGSGKAVSDDGGGSAATGVGTPQDKAVHITLSGASKFGQDMIRQLVDELNEAFGDGATLNVSQA